MSFQKRDSFLPVTSLEYVSVENEEILLAGEGPQLKAFSKDGQLLCQIEALPFKVVHGIRPLSHAPPLSAPILLTFGQKAFRVITISKKESTISLQCACEVIELNDWILDAVLLNWENSGSYELALITAHNILIHYAVKEGQVVVIRYPSEVSCILYSALIVGSRLDNLIIVSGTVFNKILLWHVYEASQDHVCVRVSFTGHQGVIFSVRLNEDHSRLVSASDDRTVRLWAVAEDWRSQKRVVESDCLLVLYGHTARVWMARPLPDCIVSIGEDSVCRVWSYSGKTIATFRGHRGKSIWSMAVDRDNNTVATGGGDCSIRVYDLRGLSQSTHFQSWVPPLSQEQKVPLPRAVFLMGHTALCLTDLGSLYAGQLCTERETVWSQVYQDTAFSNYSIAALSDSGVLALGNIHGSVRFLRLDRRGAVLKSLQIQPYSGKVFSLNWTPSGGVCDGQVIFLCGPDGRIICWELNVDSLEAKKLACLSLPASKHRWLSAVSVLPCPTDPTPFVALCGDRKGSLHLYHLTPGAEEWCDPYQTLQGVHGPNGVTYSCHHQHALYTCGRNGLCRKYRLGEDGKMVELTRFKPVKGLDWIEKVHFTEDDMLFFGFHGANFIVHSTLQNRRLLDIACGGGHRSYAVSPPQEMLALNCAQVVFVRQAEICYGVVELESGFRKSLFQPAFVGLEAESLVILDSDYESGRAVVAVGSEDCNICLLSVCPDEVSSPDSRSLEVLRMLQGHVSSVKALCSSHQTGRTLLFSGGSRASLKVWSAGKDLELGLKTGLFLHDRKSKRRKQGAKFKPLAADVPPECRVMSLTSFPLASVFEEQSPATQALHYVAAGCSDAIIRHYVYEDSEEGSFYPLPALKSSNKCVICVRHLFHRTLATPPIGEGPTGRPTHPILCSTSTDGHITFWNILPMLTDWRHTPTEPLDVPPLARFRIHQSGVNDAAIQSSSVGTTSRHTLVSVGDDNALGLVHLTVDSGLQDDMLVQVVRQHVHLAAHASAITGVCFIGENTVMSTSIDQRLNVWKLCEEDGIKLLSSHTHDVADPSSLAVYNTRQSGVVALVCGVGLQCCVYQQLHIND